MSDTPRSFDELAPKSRADQVAWEYADHIWLETLFKQRQELLGAAIQAVVNSFDSEIEDKIAGRPNDLTDEDFAVVNTWKTSMEQKQAGWASRTLVICSPFSTPSSLADSITGSGTIPHRNRRRIPRTQDEQRADRTRTKLYHRPDGTRMAPHIPKRIRS